MHRFFYILPVVTAVVLFFYYPDTDGWWEYPVMVAVCELLLYLCINRAGKTKEYLSGFATNVQHHNPWVERQEYEETYTDSKGETKTRTEVRYVKHPDEWLLELNTGKVTIIDSSVYDYYVSLWGTPMQWIDPPHVNCVSGGGGQLYVWDRVYEHALTQTYKGLYKNYVLNSNSIFRTEHVSAKSAEAFGLVEYPSFSLRFLEQDAIIVSPSLKMSVPAAAQFKLQLFNAFYWAPSQIHVFVILFAAEKGIGTALKQRSWWKGGNKNEFTICLGLEPGSMSVKWCKAFSWCDIPRMETALESWFIANPKLDFDELCMWLRNNVSLWKRKEFKDFKYLGTSLSTGRLILMGLLAVALCVGMWYIAFDSGW